MNIFGNWLAAQSIKNYPKFNQEYLPSAEPNIRQLVKRPYKNLHFDASEADEAKNCLSQTNQVGRRPERIFRRVFFAPPEGRSKWLDFYKAVPFLVTFLGAKK